jgi:DNA-binding transcriptional MerR regulator
VRQALQHAVAIGALSAARLAIGSRGICVRRRASDTEAVADVKRSLTIAEAADVTGLSKQALRRRIERGSLPHSSRNGVRYVKARDLAEAGLLDLNTGAPPTLRIDQIDTQALAQEVVQTLINQGIELHQLRAKLERVEADLRAGYEAQQEQIDQALRERRELQRQVRELRKRV